MKVSELIGMLLEIDPDIEIFVQDNDTSVFYVINEIEVSRLGEEGNQEAYIITQEEEYSE